MLLNSRNNTFYFNFPKTFMSDKIREKYKPYLTRIPGNILYEPLDFLNYTIQSINLPATGFDALEQDRKNGKKYQWRDTIPESELYQKEFTVTFQLVDGFINYWMMLEILQEYYSFENRKPYIDNLAIYILDGEGNALVTGTFIRPLIKSIDELNMSFSENMNDFKTFDVVIGYNEFNLDIDLQ